MLLPKNGDSDYSLIFIEDSNQIKMANPSKKYVKTIPSILDTQGDRLTKSALTFRASSERQTPEGSHA